ncbi:MAG: MarR family transcriptional regulator [Candidatus Thiodiazotropha sp.]|jgi:DNA-binding MarR family transcriptional regulator
MAKDRKGKEIEIAAYSVGDEIREPAQIRHYVGYAIRRAQMRLYEDFYAALAGLDMTPTRFTLLLLIRENPGIRSVDLARVLGVARSGMVRLIDDLEQRGLISREIYQQDRRNHALALTPNGLRHLVRAEKAVARHEAKVTADLSDSERTKLLQLLWRVAI